jgi:hypothetical protein
MARDRNERGGSLGGQSAGQGAGTRKRAAEGNSDERDRARKGKMTAHEPNVRNAARKSDDDETPRQPRVRNEAG